MAERKINIGKTEVVLFKGNPRVKTALAVVLVFTLAALAALSWTQHRMLRRAEEFRQESGRIEYENSVLSQSVQELGTPRGVERVAQQELDMVPRDTVLIEAQVK